MGMLYDAMRANVPLLVTAGDQDLSFNVTEPLLAGDLVAMATPLCKSATKVTRLEDLPRVLHRAVKTALAHPRGPVFIALPGDVLMSSTENLDLLRPTHIPQMIRGDRSAIEQACEMIARAKNPVIMTGDAVTQSDAVKELVEFAELVGCKVYDETVCSQAAFPSSHPLYAGAFMRQSAAVQKALEEHDLLISIGGDLFTLSLPPPPNGDCLVPHYYDKSVPGKKLKIIHMDTSDREIGKNWPVDVALLAEPKAALPEMVEILKSKHGREMLSAEITDRRTRSEADVKKSMDALLTLATAQESQPEIGVFALYKLLGSLLPSNAAIVEESISNAAHMRRFFKCDDAKSFFGMRGGGIGWGLPATIGVQLGLPDRPVVGIIGDGSSMVSCCLAASRAAQMLTNLSTIKVHDPSSPHSLHKQRPLPLPNTKQPFLPRPQTTHLQPRRRFQRNRQVCRHGPSRNRLCKACREYERERDPSNDLVGSQGGSECVVERA